MIKFSVVIPLYNKENYIKKTLQSVFNQSYLNYEVIIVNDGSTDKSINVVHQFSNENIKIINQNNQGASSARNRGIAESPNQWIALLDADDIWLKNHLKELEKTINLLPETDMVANAYEIILHKSFRKKPVYSKSLPTTPTYIDDYFSYNFIDRLFITPAIAFKKDKFESINGFDPSIISGQDAEFISRFAMNFILGCNPNITVINLKKTENNLSTIKDIRAKTCFLNKLNKYEETNPSLKKYLDINRFSLAIQSKINRNFQLYESLAINIDFNNLNQKQKILIKLPGVVLIFLKKIQVIMIKLKIYKSAFN